MIIPHPQWTADHRHQAARLLVAGFAHQPAAWAEVDDATAEIDTFFDRSERQAWALFEGDRMLGWVGAIETYDGRVWELHPIVVDPDRQGQGLGRQLLGAIENAAAVSGVLTITLGTDDDFGGTNLFGVDLYLEFPAKLAGAAATTGHPIEFYRRHGYIVTGLVPDANGPGKPDIIMSKRVVQN